MRACRDLASQRGLEFRDGHLTRIPVNPRHPLSAAFSDPVVIRVAPFAVFLAFIALSPVVAGAPRTDPATGAQWLTVLRAGVVAVLLYCFWHGYGELRARQGLPLPQWMLAIASGFAVFVVWIQFDHGWAVFGQTAPFDPTDGNGGIDLALVVPRLFGLVLVVPLMEELFWRSFLLRWLESRDFLRVEPRRVSAQAFIVTALLFAAEHNLWFAGLIAGLAYNLLYLRTGNLWVPIIAHATTNGALGAWILATRSWHLW